MPTTLAMDKFQSLKGLKIFLPPEKSPHPVKKSTIVPMNILFKDEKDKAQTTEKLLYFFK